MTFPRPAEPIDKMRSLKSVSADALASAARQLNYALQQSPNLDDAFKTLYATADERRRVTLTQLEELLRSAQPASAEEAILHSSPYPTLKWILSLAPTPELSAAAMFQEFRRQESFSTSSIAVAWSEFAGFLTYLGAVLGVLIVVVVMYAIFMMPQFRSLYGGFGRELPGLTQFAFGGGGTVFTLLLFGSLLLLISLVWFIHLLRRRLRRYSPISVSFQRLPLVGPVALAYNEYLWLSCARLLAAAGVPAIQALRLAARKSNVGEVDLERTSEKWGGPHAAAASDLAVSAQLGKLEEELQFQQDAAVDAFLTALARCRRRARVVLTICAYVLVAMFVSAMYLPIFSLGSNI
jgi:type II secretory pathway component PulF